MVTTLDVANFIQTNYNILKLLGYYINVLYFNFIGNPLFESSEGRLKIYENICSKLEH